jgi:hypothetical protein
MPPVQNPDLIIHCHQEYDDFEFEYQGADLWVNNVYLGKTPVRIPLSEFKRRVPQWDKPPQDKNDYTTSSHYSVRNVFHDDRAFTRWLRMWNPDDQDRKSGAKDVYFARLALGGTQGYGGGAFSGTGGEDVIDHDYGAAFPEIDTRIEKLLNKARLNDYKIDAAWIAALDSYGEPAWKLIKHLARREPALTSLCRQRITLGFGLDRIKTPEQAWGFLEGVMAEADRTGRFDTATSTGQAVVLVTPLLPPERLAREACRLIPQIDDLVVGWKEIEGQVEFAMPTFNRQGHFTTVNPSYGRITGGFNRDSRRQPTRALVLAQAIRFANATLLEQNPNQPTVFQKEVVLQLLRWHWRDETGLKLAQALGGPEIARFLMRQDWRSPATTFDKFHVNTRVGSAKSTSGPMPSAGSPVKRAGRFVRIIKIWSSILSARSCKRTSTGHHFGQTIRSISSSSTRNASARASPPASGRNTGSPW